MKPAILYISYDGMLEPLGQSQVIAYLEHLARDYDIHLVSFEKPADWAKAELRGALAARLAAAGLHWHPKRYHKSPSVPATLYDIALGTAAVVRLIRKHAIRFLHARSYVPALMAIGAKRLTGIPFLFDMRGFWADERVDGDLWPAGGRNYRAVKRLERTFLREAERIVTLTDASVPFVRELVPVPDELPPLDVIPTCADLERFRPDLSARPTSFTLGYVGSIGTWYLFDELLECFKLLIERRDDARMLIVNRNEHQVIADRLHRFGIDPARVEVRAAAHSEVPHYINRMTAGSALIRPVFSKIASAPTKLAEYLGCGVPCLGNRGVGDMEDVLERERTGVALEDLTPRAREAAIDRLLKLVDELGLAERCREVALRRFSLDTGVEAYRGIYKDMAA